MSKTKAAFQWDDPFLLDQPLTEDERMVRDAAHAYCEPGSRIRSCTGYPSARARSTSAS